MAGEYLEFAEAEHILKDMFEPGFKEQFKREESPLWTKLNANSDRVVGKKIVFSAKLENPQGVASRRTANESLPAAVPGKGIRISIAPGRMYGVIEFDDQILAAAGASKLGRGEFIDYVQDEMKGLKTTFREDCSRQAYGDGKGFLSVCGVTAGVLILQLGATANMLDFIEGMHIDIAQASHSVAKQLNINDGDRLVRIQRIQLADGKPVAIMRNFILPEKVPGIEKYVNKFSSLYEFLEDRYSINIDSAKDSISARCADFDEAAMLNIELGAAILYMRRVTFEEGQPVCADRISIVGDKYEIDINMKGRVKKTY